ncbi:30S ribosomal protein S8 [Candidatus Dojkabacteria bacterium]|uniref:Small ribosomal subunit protein uS8 n=1 Tax=Candidatus Dojkabacteria bacterium TaxID=2099670 RepID=A0A955KVS7_9BACT|nr:30S ribosomal protein S8 [Candidatus Dojkabacteria bacterium]MCB9790796.1 30S ribosomal protein S8 [Candidatus Nomurabacteria bacterium]
MVTDIIADTLTRIKNSSERNHETVDLLTSKMVLAVLEILKQEGFIKEFSIEDGKAVAELAYDDKNPVIHKVEKVSTPGQRVYVSTKEILPVLNGRGISIISTSQGLMTGAMAKSKRLGGEYICNIW